MSETTNQQSVMESAESAPPKASKRDPLLIVIAVLLALVLVVQIYTVIDTRQQRQSVDERAALAAEAEQERIAAEAERAAQFADSANSITLLSALQDELAADLFENYQEDAYDNPRIDRITEQQLIATEYQLLASQMLGLQNQAIIDLLALQYQLPDLTTGENSAE